MAAALGGGEKGKPILHIIQDDLANTIGSCYHGHVFPAHIVDGPPRHTNVNVGECVSGTGCGAAPETSVVLRKIVQEDKEL
jgi:hypothetical protein